MTRQERTGWLFTAPVLTVITIVFLAPTFLALTGYEQVRSVAAHLAGDHEAAARTERVLPDIGVCGGAGAFDAPVGGCCAPTPVSVQLGRQPVT